MEGWTCIFSSVHIHETEMMRAILQENQIDAIVVNKQDSVYLFGEIELYVRFEDAFIANQIIKPTGNLE
jgi:hypothetical protein